MEKTLAVILFALIVLINVSAVIKTARKILSRRSGSVPKTAEK